MGYRYILLGTVGNPMTYSGDDGEKYVLAVDTFRDSGVVALSVTELELAQERGEVKDGRT